LIESWRIDRKLYRATAFTGEGARLYGGRWNSQGVSVVYTAEHRSLAMLEILVHLTKPKDYELYSVKFDESLVQELAAQSLPRNWDVEPPTSDTQEIGDNWVNSASSAVLSVPSAVVPEERNYILNPRHPAFEQIQIDEAFPCHFDPRLLGAK
jgi:RES domain-containing protein